MSAKRVREQPDAWLAARREGIGGSDAAAVCGLSQYTTRLGVWLDKTGRLDRRGATVAQQWGHHWEGLVLRWFAVEHDIRVRRAGLLADRDRPWLRATPDAYAHDGGLVQVKTTSRWSLDHWADGQVPDEAEVQVQHEMAVTGRPHAWVVALVDGRDLLVRKVRRDENLIQDLVGIEEQFWTEHVLTDSPPALDGPLPELGWLRSEPGKALPLTDELRALLIERQEAKTWERRATEKVEEINDQIRLLMGDAEQVIDPAKDRTVVTYRRGGVFAGKRFSDAHPFAAADCERPVMRVDPKLVRERHPELWAEYAARVLRVNTTKSGNGKE